MNSISCDKCGHVYTDKEIFRLADISDGVMRIDCPKCGEYNIHLMISVLEDDK